MDVMAELLGESPPMEAVREKLRRLLERARARQRLPPVLLQGETGTGKGLVARLLHRHGPRAQGFFVDVNCAAIPETLLEAELFGFERGAFTDARRAKPGLFQAAHGGVLFLDEISLLASSAQAKLLTAVEDRAVRRLGSARAEPADVWLISATNVDLEEAARTRQFRADLYHRLAILTIEIPPLRVRDGDVLTLARGFLDRTCAEYGLPSLRLDASAERRLLAHSWPGNVRELGNVIERAALLADGSVLTAAALEPSRAAGAGSADQPSPASRNDVKRERLVAALNQTGWNVSQTAALLGVARNTVYAHLDRFGLRPEPPGRSGSGRQASTAVASDSTLPPTLPTALRWETRNLALLRVDLGETDRADSWSLASRTLDLAIAKVVAFGGRVEDMTPTGVVATFGLEPTEDAARRAAHAALAIHRTVQRLAVDIGERRPPVAIGMHVSPFLIGHLENRTEIDAQAKRAQWAILDELLQRTAPGQTTATAAAARFLERRFELAPAETDPGVTILRLTGQERRGLGLWEVMTPFVGRREELDLLRHRSTLAASGHGQVIAILGDAGVGKSRLIHEFARAQRLDGWRVLETTAVSHGQAMSYLPIIALLKDYFAILDGDDVPAAREKVAATLDPTLHSALPALLALLDVSTDEAPWRTLDPPQRRQRILDAVRRLLLCEAREHPLLLIVEDLHWVDGETQALLDSLVDSLRASRLLLLVSYRPGYQHAWASKPSYTQLPLDVLPVEQAAEFLSALVGDDADLAPLKQRLVKRGNPFFLEETVRTLVESQGLEGRQGDYRLARPLASLEIPPTVQAILTARIDRLPLGDKQLLQTAAVIGKDVPLVLLHAIAGTDDTVMRAGLARLQAAEFVYEVALSREPGVTFKHALTHEVAYGSLLHERRKILHARIVGAIETLYRDRLDGEIERLAHHAVRGELHEKAVRYGRQVGERGYQRVAYRAGITGYEQAIEALGHLSETPDTKVLAVELRCSLVTLLNNSGEYQRGLTILSEAELLARQLDDRALLARVLAHTSYARRGLGDLDGALSAGRQGLEIAAARGDTYLQANASYRLAQACYEVGDLGRAVELLRASLEGFRSSRSSPAGRWLLSRATANVRRRYSLISSQAWLARVLSVLGEFDEGRRHGEEALRLALEEGPGEAPIIAHGSLGLLYLAQGDLEAAIPVLERGVATVRATDSNGWKHVLVGALGTAYGHAGRFAEGLALLEEAERNVVDRGFPTFQAICAGDLSAVYVLAGRPDVAWPHACRALDLARQVKACALEARALFELGIIHTHADSPDAQQGETTYREALALAEPRGMRPLIAHCHHGLGTLYRRTGTRQQAEEHLTIARTMYREMDMTYWLEQAGREVGA